MSNQQFEFKSIRKSFYQFMLFVFAVSVVWYGLMRTIIYKQKAKLQSQNDIMNQISLKMEALGQFENYTKLEFANKIKIENKNEISREDRINLIIDTLQTMTNLSYGWGKWIKLYDFNVSLEKMSLRWEVSDISLLYFDSTDSKQNLIDLIKKLPFVQNIEIKKYESSDDTIKFSLNATLDIKKVKPDQVALYF